MPELIANLRIVTPAFVGGATPDTAELRPPTIKAQLRFWWRALALGRLDCDLARVQVEEDRLFGSTRSGQGQFLISVHRDGPLNILKKGKVLQISNGNTVGPGARYLGYGVMEAFASRKKGTKEGQLTRPCIKAPLTFSVSCRFRPARNSEDRAHLERCREQLVAAIKAWTLFGAMGSKARKGYGSVSLVSLRWDGAEIAVEGDYQERARGLLTDVAHVTRPENVPYTAFSSLSEIVFVKGTRDQDPLDLLDSIGKEQVFFRSWGRGGKVLGQPSEKNFEEDHDLSKGDRRVSIKHPKRVAFGLPHNYGSSSKQQVTGKSVDRRASPLFIHLEQPYDDSTPTAIISLMPAKFLPEDRIKSFDKEVDLDTSSSFWNPLTDYLERLENNLSATRHEMEVRR